MKKPNKQKTKTVDPEQGKLAHSGCFINHMLVTMQKDSLCINLNMLFLKATVYRDVSTAADIFEPYKHILPSP